MPKYPKHPGPFREYKFIPDKRIERAALTALEETRLLPTSPSKVAIEKFCDRKWGFPEDYRDLGPDFLGRATFNINGLVSIEVNARLEEDTSRVGVCRLRSTIAHEAGHGILQASMFIEKIAFDQGQMALFEDVDRKQKPPEPTMIATRSNAIDSTPQPFEWWEYQANRFMAEVLMPKPLLLEVMSARINPEKLLTKKLGWTIDWDALNAQDDVADIFGVSKQMAQIAVSRYVKELKKEGERAQALL